MPKILVSVGGPLLSKLATPFGAEKTRLAWAIFRPKKIAQIPTRLVYAHIPRYRREKKDER